MRYTTDERGLLNNFAVEPVVYAAEFPSPEQQRQYLWQGAIGVLLVASALFVAVAVS